MKKSVLILSVLCAAAIGFSCFGATDSAPLVVQSNYMDYVKKQNADIAKKDKSKTITMSALDAVKLAGKLVDTGDYDQASRILTMMPQTNSLPVEIERCI